MGSVSNWLQFAKERFPLVEHGVMLGFFTLGNFMVALNFSGVDPAGVFLEGFVLFIVTFLFFFRLRCFDEVKDYEVDLEQNPTRPLARGLLSVYAAKKMIFLLAGVESFLMFWFFFDSFFVYALALVYSFLMYKEFFVGDLLRPQLTLYAVFHTFVSVMVGLFIVAGALGYSFSELPVGLVVFSLTNWALFNLFEFARKTFSPLEERAGVDTYSSLFGPKGAAALSLSQVVFGCFVLAQSQTSVLCYPWSQYILALLPVSAGVCYALAPNRYAKLFRTGTGAYLVLFYLVLSVQAYISILANRG